MEEKSIIISIIHRFSSIICAYGLMGFVWCETVNIKIMYEGSLQHKDTLNKEEKTKDKTPWWPWMYIYTLLLLIEVHEHS